MVVLSNRRLGPAAEVLVSPEVARELLRGAAEAARPVAEGRWEHELVAWLEDRAQSPGGDLDVSDIAWSPEHFDRQRRFVVEALERAAAASTHARAFGLWARLIAEHRRELVVVGRRWRWAAAPAVNA